MERRIAFTTEVETVHSHILRHEVTQREKNRGVIKKIFSCIHFLIRQKWAISTNTEKFVRFVASLGVEDLQTHLKTSEQKYLTSTHVTEMVVCLSNVIERKMLADLKDKTFSLFADDSTDFSNRTQMSVMVRFASDSGSIENHFMGFIQLDKTRAVDIMEALEAFFMAKNISMKKARFLCFDGCNTMSGEIKGKFSFLLQIKKGQGGRFPATLFRIHVIYNHLSRVMRKPTICICENKDADQLRGNHEADQRLCFCYLDSTIPLLSKSKISSL